MDELRGYVSKIDIKDDKDVEKILRQLQYIPYNLFINKIPRGMLLFMGTGYGKSRVAAAITNKLISSYKCIFIANKSLHENFAETLRLIDKTLNKSLLELDKKVHFVSLNASNMIDQLKNAGKLKVIKDYEKEHEIISGLDLENSFLIFDEAHIFFNRIVNGSKQALKLYNEIMKTKRIKLLFMTATPIINHPFELVPLTHLCLGKNVFPTSFTEFTRAFLDKDNIINEELLLSKLCGFISYFGSYGKELNQKTGFPEELPLIVRKIPMSETQYSSYMSARRYENLSINKDLKGKLNKAKDLVKPPNIGSFRVHSRLSCNFAIDREYSTDVKVDNKIDTTKFTLKELAEYSPKLVKLIEDVKYHMDKNEPGVIFCPFVNGPGGTNGISTALSICLNFVQLSDENINTIKYDYMRYAIYSSDQMEDEKNKITEIFNDKDNVDGKKISVIIFSPTAAQGVNWTNGRYVIVFNSLWNLSTLFQIIARIVRYGALSYLPLKERKIQPYLYLASHKSDKITTDEYLYSKAVQMFNIIQKFLELFVRASIDCFINSSDVVTCYSCRPQELRDKYNINNEDESFSLSEFNIDGIKVYVRRDPTEIYIKKGNSYIKLHKHESLFKKVISALSL
jgi:hypothetical protein